jgi:hypothetical protein
MFWKTACLWTVAATVALTAISLSQEAAQLTGCGNELLVTNKNDNQTYGGGVNGAHPSPPARLSFSSDSREKESGFLLKT